ncbi:MAG: hypothetical protein QOF76_4560 [Solirubrobacteraceae bacterium]|jgi:AraC-like DNA-binding protein|nr:hypothetical protein [Solirubrobacteraceae bacterium]
MADLKILELDPSPELAPHVSRACIFEERPELPISQPELPFTGAVIILVFGDPLEIDGETITSFASGIYDRPVMTTRDGHQQGLQLYLTPFATRRLLGVPMDELTNRVVPLDADELLERAADQPDPHQRWRIVEDAFARRIREAPAPRRELTYAYDRITNTHGEVKIEALAKEIGWSRRHLAATFKQHVGVTPKTLARIARFERARALLARGDDLADVAFTCGFADQPHFNREYRALAGATPTA